MHVSGHIATYRSNVTANMYLIGERYFLYRYRVQCDRALTQACVWWIILMKNRNGVLWPDNLFERPFVHQSVAFNRWKMNTNYTIICLSNASNSYLR